MDNIEYIKNNFNKNPTIMKALLKMDDIESVDQKQIIHFNNILKTNKIQQSNLKLSYTHYNNFNSFYHNLVQWINIDPIDIGFHSLSMPEKEDVLKKYKIKYHNEDGVLVIFPSSFEETRIVGSKNWCIFISKSMWLSYNKNKTHIVIINNEDIYGISLSKKSFKCFNKNDMPIPYFRLKQKFKKIVTDHLKLYNRTLDYIKIFSLNVIFIFLYISIIFIGESYNINEQYLPMMQLITAIVHVMLLVLSEIGIMALLCGLIFSFISVMNIDPFLTKENLHYFYDFEQSISEKEEEKQTKTTLNYEAMGDITNFKEKGYSNHDLFDLINNLTVNKDNSLYLELMRDTDIQESIRDFGDYEKKIMYKDLVLVEEFEKLKIMYNLFLITESDKEVIVKYIIKYDKIDLSMNLLTHHIIDPALDNNALLRWASFNNYDKIIEKLLSYSDVTKNIDQKWLDNYIVNKNISINDLGYKGAW